MFDGETAGLGWGTKDQQNPEEKPVAKSRNKTPITSGKKKKKVSKARRGRRCACRAAPVSLESVEKGASLERESVGPVKARSPLLKFVGEGNLLHGYKNTRES